MGTFGTMNILVVNAGSSTYKLSLFAIQNDYPVIAIWKGIIDWNAPIPFLKVETIKGVKFEKNLAGDNKKKGITDLLETLWKGQCQVISSLDKIERIGHRVVHGGILFDKPVLITCEVKEQIKKLISLAPLHNPASLEEIEFFERLFPSILQVAVFDTSFHLSMPEEIKTYPIPKKWRDLEIQRYGFHGISHQYCNERIESFLGQKDLKVVNCHLGNGCSLCAINKGKSLATTMGFTPLEGLMMGTRSGSIDPGILLYLMQEHGYKSEDLQRELNFESGLHAICGSSDMRKILETSSEAAKLALRMFVFRLKSFIGSMVAILGGIDILSFTGGIGENSSTVREETCQGLEFLGLKLNVNLNYQCNNDEIISDAYSKNKIMVIHTQEEWMIARACFQLTLN